jgi:hypothetical protein
MLDRTKSVYLGERLFSSGPWPSKIFATMPDLIMFLLRATKSLTKIHIYSTDKIFETPYNYQMGSQLQSKLGLAATDPSFLPNLAIIIELPNHISLRSLCQNRLIAFSCYHFGSCMYADIYPGFGGGVLAGIDIKRTFSAYDIGSLILEIYYISPKINTCRAVGISIHMRFPNELERGVQGPVRNPIDWTRTMLEASKIPRNQFLSIDITFEPSPPFQSVDAQFAQVEELHEDFPELENVKMSYPELQWSRSLEYDGSESRTFESDTLPEWTPCPVPDYSPCCINWWLKELRLASPETQSDEEFAETIAKLADGILLRWDSHTFGGYESLIESLFKCYNRSNRSS